MKRKISPIQYASLIILLQGGKIFYFSNDNTFGLDDVNGNTLKFSISTFRALRIRKLIEIKESPNIHTEIWGLTEYGNELIFKKIEPFIGILTGYTSLD